MHPLLTKLNFKDHPVLHVVNLPAPLQPLLQDFAAHCKTSTSKTVPAGTTFVIAFATKQIQVDQFAAQVASKTVDDAVVRRAITPANSIATMAGPRLAQRALSRFVKLPSTTIGPRYGCDASATLRR